MMIPIMPAMRGEYQKRVEEEGIASDESRGEIFLKGVEDYHNFCVDYLSRVIGHDQVLMGLDRQQYSLTDYSGSGDLPDSGAVHAIGQPIKRNDLPRSGAVQVNG